MTIRKSLLTLLAAGITGLVIGCSGADNPQIPEAKPFVPTAADKETKNVPARVKNYGANKKYQEAMEQMYNLK